MTGRRHLPALMACLASLALGACSMGDVELNGKIFELAGLSGSGNTTKTPELKTRTGLVVPPDLSRLPDPNQPAAPPAQDALAAINDPDRARVVDQAELQRQQAEACKKYELAKARGETDADMISGPLGPCRKSVLTGLTNWMKSDSSQLQPGQ